MDFFSQAGQDKWVIEQTDHKTNGFFVDIGAYDGIESSNTLTLEKYYDWNGICIEPNSSAFLSLDEIRKSQNFLCACRDYNGFCQFIGDRVIGSKGGCECFLLEDLLQKANAPYDIDYVSLDVEGLEYEILNSFDFTKRNIKLWTIEHNLYLGDDTLKKQVKEIMINNGYELAVENVTHNGIDPFEDWYIKK